MVLSGICLSCVCLSASDLGRATPKNAAKELLQKLLSALFSSKNPEAYYVHASIFIGRSSGHVSEIGMSGQHFLILLSTELGTRAQKYK